jgi:hypothetical protein
MRQFIPLAKLLTYAGAIPFVVCAGLQVAGIANIASLGQVMPILLTYGIVIAAFMAGTHWGLALDHTFPCASGILLSSTALTLLAWFAYLSGSIVVALGTLIATFSLLLFIDWQLYQRHVQTKEYFQLRVRVTAVVLAALTVALLSHYNTTI